jgi:transposase
MVRAVFSLAKTHFQLSHRHQILRVPGHVIPRDARAARNIFRAAPRRTGVVRAVRDGDQHQTIQAP